MLVPFAIYDSCAPVIVKYTDAGGSIPVVLFPRWSENKWEFCSFCSNHIWLVLTPAAVWDGKMSSSRQVPLFPLCLSNALQSSSITHSWSSAVWYFIGCLRGPPLCGVVCLGWLSGAEERKGITTLVVRAVFAVSLLTETLKGTSWGQFRKAEMNLCVENCNLINQHLTKMWFSLNHGVYL